MPNRIIEQDRQGLWIAATFVIALFALVLAFINMNRTHALAVGTQIEILSIDKRINKMSTAPASAVEISPAAAPSTDAPASE